MKIELGYCCVSQLNKKLKCSRSSTKTYLDSHDDTLCHDYLLEKARQNISDLITLLNENEKNHIKAYRMPEQILPQLDLGYYKINEVKEQLYLAGRVANSHDAQLSTHPSQYYVLNSLRKEVVDKSILSLDLFAETMACMELKKVPNMTLHVGMKGGYESTDAALQAFCKNFKRLGEYARQYLVLENDHVSFQVEDCLKVHEEIGIPIVFDNKHYEWNKGNLGYEEAVEKAASTWQDRIPKLHLSSDKEGNKHAHDEYIAVSDYRKMESAIKKAGISQCYVMLECKEKDVALLKLREDLEKAES